MSTDVSTECGTVNDVGSTCKALLLRTGFLSSCGHRAYPLAAYCLVPVSYSPLPARRSNSYLYTVTTTRFAIGRDHR